MPCAETQGAPQVLEEIPYRSKQSVLMSLLDFIFLVPVKSGGPHEHVAAKIPDISENAGKILPDQPPNGFPMRGLDDLFFIQVIAAAPRIAKQLVVFILLSAAHGRRFGRWPGMPPVSCRGIHS
jgi:hypothetical protein